MNNRKWLFPLAYLGWLSVAAADGGALCEAPTDSGRGAESPVVIERFVYRDKSIAVSRTGNRADDAVRVCVDGRQWPADLIVRVGDEFTSRLLPYQQFPKLPDLIKTLIDNDGVLFRIGP
ncbi:hypothetical protein EWI61_10135 [Methylolobus aquaticus]|nr:hypothetical protein EWI61_10135 [Methylolobus aquaticus]